MVKEANQLHLKIVDNVSIKALASASVLTTVVSSKVKDITVKSASRIVDSSPSLLTGESFDLTVLTKLRYAK